MFEGGKVKYGDKSRKEMPIFDYIKRSTQGRPRDFVRYIQVCAGKAVEREKNKISSRLVSQQDKSFSNYLRSELEDEMHGVIPEIKSVLNIFTKMRKQTLPIRDFKDAYEDEVKAGKVPDRGYQFVLEVLFLFSVIGNQPKQRNKQVFKYLNKEARLNMNESIVVHRGLFKSLQIM